MLVPPAVSTGVVAQRIRWAGLMIRAIAACGLLIIGWMLEFSVHGMREQWLMRWSGYIASLALVLSVLIGPLWRCCGRPLAFRARYGRRELGLIAAEWATIHVALVVAMRLHGDLSLMFITPFYRSGVTAWLLLVVLWMTSFPWLVKKTNIGPAWPTIHRGAPVVAPVVVVHLLMNPLSDKVGVLVVAAMVLVMLLLRLGLALRLRERLF